MAHTQHWMSVSSRVAAALFGGYVFSWGFASLVVAASLALGGDYDEGVTLAYMLAFLVYLCVVLWSFATVSLMRVWLVLAGGGIAMIATAWSIARMPGLSY